MGESLRALVGARVSVLRGEQKVSHIAQKETGTKWVTDRGHTIVGTFEDLDVSASISPFNRRDLGPWLTAEREHEWDVVVFSKIDRMFRSTRDCVRFAEWAEEHKKILVFAEDGMTLNYRDKDASGSIESMMSELFIYIGSFFAQLELNRFKSRTSDSHRVLRTTARWAGGTAPLGYQVVDHPDGKGKVLDTDPDGKALLHDIAGKLFDGWSLIRIAQWLNDTGVPSNRDKARIVNGKEAKERPWAVSTLTRTLTSYKTQGFKMHRQKPLLDASGEMIRMAPPTFDDDTWKKIQEAIALRQATKSRTNSPNPMLGIGYCDICGASLAQKFRRKGDVAYRYYRCGRSPVQCPGVNIRADEADETLENSFIANYGNENTSHKVFVPGEDNSHDLEQVRATIERLRRESDMGLVVTPEDEEIYLQRMKSLIERRTVLEATPVRPAGWATVVSDKTYADAWETEDHHKLLVDRGVKYFLISGTPRRFRLYVPELEGAT
ncbi:recombinase family protein [Mycobacteroides chelonae]|uniref:recombinase family protein n=1 Tax=Mycobacteroides chelonae TaxID=1774 RepID=UPI0009926543|nr:recombinase family protein [Mycobacteroides chelonae]